MWWIIVLLLPDDIGGSIRGAIVNNEQVELAIQCHHSIDHRSYILAFFIGGDNDQFIGQGVLFGKANIEEKAKEEAEAEAEAKAEAEQEKNSTFTFCRYLTIRKRKFFNSLPDCYQ